MSTAAMSQTRYYTPYRPEGSSTPSEDATSVPAHFRRSVSIFSRKGAETPEPMPAFITQAGMRGSIAMPTRQKTWKLGRAMSVKSTSSKLDSPKSPRGTILNAVPPARMIHMTKLEEEMATSPNDEILSAISENAPSVNAHHGSQPVSPIEGTILRTRSHSMSSPRTRSQYKKDRLNSRVGVWVDGVVHWDSAVFVDDDETDTFSDTGFTPVRPRSSGDKPQLSVVIPSDEPLINDKTLSTILQPQPRRPLVSLAPPTLTSRFAVKPLEPIEMEKEVSPAESEAEQPPALPPRRPHAPVYIEEEKQVVSRHSTSSSSGNNTDSGSEPSRRSSATSLELIQTSPCDKNKPLPPLPNLNPKNDASSTTAAYRQYRSTKSFRAIPHSSRVHHGHLRQSRSISELDSCDRQFMRTSPYARYLHGISPTLSQAEEELRDELDTMSPQVIEEPKELEDTSVSKASRVVRRKSSVSDVMEPPARAPSIPKRSRKRDWRATGAAAKRDGYLPAPEIPSRRRSDSQMTQSENVHRPRKSASVHASNQKLLVNLTSKSSESGSTSTSNKDQTNVVDFASSEPQRGATDALDSAEKSWLDIEADSEVDEEDEDEEQTAIPETIQEADESAVTTVPSASAENVLLGILSSLQSLQDLFNTALINKGMYRVYKENEMELIRTISYNESPPAWELREWSSPDKNDVGSSKASSMLDHTPLSYQRCHNRDLAVIERLKRLILEKCQTFIRRETAFALSTPSHPNAARYNDAFWRIWCFCKIFGCDKGREDDITGQLDWLKGGLLANNQGCVATVNTNLDFDMSSVLLNAPDYFSKANLGGLSAAQLFDMTELWTCMTSLLHGYQGRIDQARRYGVFDALDVDEGDTEKEHLALEEWTAYLLTLGPAVVLDMAELASDPKPAGFAFAQRNGMTEWAPPIYNNNTRTTFLKEPVSKIYEEQVVLAKLRLQDPVEQEMKERSRQRVASLANEIKLLRQTSAYKRLPLIDMNSERPMSVFSRSGSSRSTWSYQSRSTTGRRANNTPSSSSSAALWEPPKQISPIMEDRNEHNYRLSLQNFGAGIAEDTSERAVRKIVSMGFTVKEAREALKVTDMGDGIKLERAVELLLKRQQAAM